MLENSYAAQWKPTADPMPRRKLRPAAILCLALCLVLTAGPLRAAGIPLLVGAPPSDQLSYFTAILSEGMAPVPVLRFVPGLSGAYALRNAAAAPGSVAVFALPAFALMGMDPTSPYSAGDLEAVLLAGRVPAALWVPQDSPIVDLPAFITLVRQPGASVFCAGPGRFTAPHLASVIFNREIGVVTTFMPMVGTDEAGKAALDGRVQAVWAYALAPETLPGFRPLAVAAEARSAALPDTPTFAEYQLAVTAWAELGFALAPGTRDKPALIAAIRAGRDDPDALAEQARLGFSRLPKEGDDLQEYLRQQSSLLKGLRDAYPRLTTD